MSENKDYLNTQIITYIGNKRSLLSFIGEVIEDVLEKEKKDKLSIVDLFSGSGIVSRYLKRYSDLLITNDLEGYSYTLNKCYLANTSEIDIDLLKEYYKKLNLELKNLSPGFITELYAPNDSEDIKKGERVFYTTRNAMYIDTAVKVINTFPKDIRPFFLAPLIVEASIKNNTGGVFKGFYKNESGIGQFGGRAENNLSRIKSDIKIPFPIFSNYECKIINYKEDSNKLVKKLDYVDLIYIDPPYNQHPYGSNYFMLNLINDYKRPKSISRVSGIPNDWNRSNYNYPKKALKSLKELCNNCNCKYILLSFNNEGFISKEDMMELLSSVGKVKVFEKKYNTYKASRNLNNRNKYTYEYLFLVEKEV